jgi:hypothetical protein
MRESISNATNLFIVDYLNKFDLLTEDADENDEKEKYSLYKKSISRDVFKERLTTFSIDYKYAEFNAHPKLSEVGTLLVEYLKLYNYYLDLLTVVGVNGVYSLVNKSDVEGFYSIGNCVDIVNAINIIHEFIEDEYMKTAISDCKKVFQEGIEKNMVVAVLFEPMEIKPKRFNFLGQINYNALRRKSSK